MKGGWNCRGITLSLARLLAEIRQKKIIPFETVKVFYRMTERKKDLISKNKENHYDH